MIGIAEWQFGLKQWPVILMIENYKSGLIWHMKRCPHIIKGLQRAGFSGGWLDQLPERRAAHNRDQNSGLLPGEGGRCPGI